MERGQLLAKWRRARLFLGEAIKLAQIEVDVLFILQTAPGYRLGAEIGRNGVDGRCCLILALESLASVIAQRNLDDMALRNPWRAERGWTNSTYFHEVALLGAARVASIHPKAASPGGPAGLVHRENGLSAG